MVGVSEDLRVEIRELQDQAGLLSNKIAHLADLTGIFDSRSGSKKRAKPKKRRSQKRARAREDDPQLPLD